MPARIPTLGQYIVTEHCFEGRPLIGRQRAHRLHGEYAHLQRARNMKARRDVPPEVDEDIDRIERLHVMPPMKWDVYGVSGSKLGLLRHGHRTREARVMRLVIFDR